VVSQDIINDFILSNFPDVNISNSGTHWNFRCPLCGDSQTKKNVKRFHIDYNNGTPGYHCFRCGEHGSFIEFYCKYTGLNSSEAYRTLYKYNPDSIKRKLNPLIKNKKTPIIEYKDYSYILKECIEEDKEYKGYSEKKYQKIIKSFRKFRQIPDNQKLYYAYCGKYANRIIIPIFQEEKMVYFQARGLNPKYLNPPTEKQIIIFNLDKFDSSKYIIITEGLLDALSVGNNGTCLLQAYIDDKFIEKLLKHTEKGIIIALDNDDAGKKMLNKFINESKYSDVVKYFIYKYNKKDLNEIKTSWPDINIYEHVLDNTFNKLQVIVKMKLGG